jgi:hypothetical protein
MKFYEIFIEAFGFLISDGLQRPLRSAVSLIDLLGGELSSGV